ncbi:MAG: hypothetical protein COA42_16215 [Alteromonadaceae bacterium]|nr:MAG: hypothetical protein COA42_16215 [Alteromonadaceae bacterium]
MKKHTQPVLAISYFVEVIAFLKELNVDTDDLCNNLNITQRQMDDPAACITISQFSMALSYARKLCNGSISGLVFGGRLGPASHGLAGLSAVTQPNVGECFQTIEKVFEHRFPIFTIEYIQEDDYFGLRFTEVLPLGEDLAFLIEAIFSSFYNIGVLQSKESHNIHKINFSFREPENSSMYHELFGNNIEFDSAYCEYFVPIDRFYDPIILSNSTASTHFLRQLEDETPEPNKDMLPKTILSILEQEQEHLPSITEMAGKLSMSDRTLRRKINSFNTTYHDLLMLHKRRKAIAYLRDTKKSITEISGLLCYQDPSHFSKAFREWTGCSPTQYRKEYED